LIIWIGLPIAGETKLSYNTISLFRVMGAAAGSTPAQSVLNLILLWLLVLFLGYSKIRFASFAVASLGAGKEEGGSMVTLNNSAIGASAFFDTLHGLGIGALAASAVP
jgi:hypothetical protein